MRFYGTVHVAVHPVGPSWSSNPSRASVTLTFGLSRASRRVDAGGVREIQDLGLDEVDAFQVQDEPGQVRVARHDVADPVLQRV